MDAALAVCAGCPVREPCLDAAMAEEAAEGDGQARYGVRGGLTAEERRARALLEPA